MLAVSYLAMLSKVSNEKYNAEMPQDTERFALLFGTHLLPSWHFPELVPRHFFPFICWEDIFHFSGILFSLKKQKHQSDVDCNSFQIPLGPRESLVKLLRVRKISFKCILLPRHVLDGHRLKGLNYIGGFTLGHS